MNTCPLRTCAVRAVVAVSAALVLAAPAFAARVGVLSNKFAAQTAADFNSRIPTHAFTPLDTSTTIPTLQSLTDAFDVILVFEDSTFGSATAVGNAAAAFANSGRAVVIGAFYDQDRSDGPAANAPHGWGALEEIDPNTTDGTGTPYAPRSLDTATMARHPLTGGLTSLTSAKFAGGNRAKPGTTVVAWWKEPNALGQPDPAIAYRMTGPACVVQVAIAPNYPSTGIVGTDYTGDFHRAWKNAFDFATGGCIATTGEATTPDPAAIPTLSQWGLLLTILLVGAAAAPLRRRISR
jgi:IPTL-CTERM motif